MRRRHLTPWFKAYFLFLAAYSLIALSAASFIFFDQAMVQIANIELLGIGVLAAAGVILLVRKEVARTTYT